MLSRLLRVLLIIPNAFLALTAIAGGIGLLSGAAPPVEDLAPLASAAAAVVIIIFELVEVLVIRSPPGVARNLQIFYSALGLVILALSISWLMAGRRATSKP